MARIGVRARAVDLLGRQQVAGIPTAISELFKNAHDAYARSVAVDFFRVPQLLVLRDDGVGMSRRDFETRWLTIGTESKAGAATMAAPPRDESQPVRPVMGEKGIGRLAIALIGPQVLILTRPQPPAADETTCAFLNWSTFSLPGVDLADIDVPILTLPGGAMPTREQVSSMTAAAAAGIADLLCPDEAAKARIVAEIERFRFDPSAIVLPDETLDLRVHNGTQFWISPVNEVLASDIDVGKSSDSATPLQKVLLGFANTMTPGHTPPPVSVAFRDHLGEGLSYERIAEDNFFTPEEFANADHHITGRFDERGQFRGDISVYGGEPTSYMVRWENPDGADTACGPVDIDFAYVQGAARESRLPREEWAAITDKLNRIGGLYIYRNGIRILPYGDSDYDFLNIENRRTRSAGYYFFSYRRIFGVVSISSDVNANLVEKAGREGFQENKAYRQFKSMLENFFIQTAADFFRDEGIHTPVFAKEKERLSREQELLARRRKQAGPQRSALQSALDAFFAQIGDEGFARAVDEVVREAEAQLATAAERSLTSTGVLVQMNASRRTLGDIDRAARVTRPRSLGLTRTLSREWARYEIERATLEREVFTPGYARIDEIIEGTARRLDLDLDGRRVVADALEQRSDEERRRVRGLRNDVERDADKARERAVVLARRSFETLDTQVKETLIGFEHLGDDQLSPERFGSVRDRLETEISSVAEAQSDLLTRLRDQLRAAATIDALDRDEVQGALETELEDRRERDLESLQLAQMGMAIGIVHHEFQSVIRVVRQNVRRLKGWADRNSALSGLYEDISRSYSHLDGYLSLFAPLNRRLARTKREITGTEIERYLRQLLDDRMRRHGVELVVTDAFRCAAVEDLVATVYPPFVNILDNALHWLDSGDAVVRAGAAPRGKTVTLDFADGSFVIADTGPGVLPADHGAVFESGFSRKPGGSGLGLYITRTLLEQAGYRLTLDPYTAGVGAVFRITPPLGAAGGDAAGSDQE